MQAVQMEPLTVEDYRMMPETGPRYQLIEGDLYTAPAPNRFRQDISGNIYFMLRDYLEKHPIGKLYEAPFVVYLDQFNAHQPDIVFVSKSNCGILTDAGAEGAPDFIIEILSPKTAFLDKKSKRKVYARAGVKELWFVDPDTRMIHVYFLQDDPDRPAAAWSEKDTFRSPHFPGLRISARKIFKR
ncbi:MAG: Uma2 family endonuclease [Verrucomicrobia bacterium]|nr:Uma2 family endonuclease [Verrucomicrobiota bacterium]